MILPKTRQTTQRQIRTRKRTKRIERDFSVLNLPILSLHFIAVKREKFLQELRKFFKAKVVTNCSKSEILLFVDTLLISELKNC